jgi:hypothetical protein
MRPESRVSIPGVSMLDLWSAEWQRQVYPDYFGFPVVNSYSAVVPYSYTRCPRRNVPKFGRVFLMLKYTDISQNTYNQSWTVTEIMAREKCGLLAVPRTVPPQLTALPVHCACPSLRVSLLPMSDCVMNGYLVVRSLPCSLKGLWYTCTHIRICHVKCLEP